MIAALSGAGAVVPVPGFSVAFDTALLKNEVDKYKHQLGFSEEASLAFKGISPMKKLMFKFSMASAQEIGKLMKYYLPSSTVEEFAQYTPLVESAISSSGSFSATYHFLNGCLKELERGALDYLDEIHAESAIINMERN